MVKISALAYSVYCKDVETFKKFMEYSDVLMVTDEDGTTICFSLDGGDDND